DVVSDDDRLIPLAGQHQHGLAPSWGWGRRALLRSAGPILARLPCRAFMPRTARAPVLFAHADLASGSSERNWISGWRVVHFVSVSTTCCACRVSLLMTIGPSRFPVSQSPTLLQITRT